MPSNVVAFDKMSIGLKGSGKHWTKKEVDARAQASEKMQRAKVRLHPPQWIKEDPDSFDVWKRTVKRLKGVALLDDVDSDTLAIYCKSVAAYEREIKTEHPTSDEMQKWSRIILSYAEKLGMTPNGRARLAKKKADNAQRDPNGELFD